MVKMFSNQILSLFPKRPVVMFYTIIRTYVRVCKNCSHLGDNTDLESSRLNACSSCPFILVPMESVSLMFLFGFDNEDTSM